MADEDVQPLLHPVGHPRLPLVRGHGVGLHHRNPEPVAGEDVLHPSRDVAGTRVGHVDQRPAPGQPLGGHQVYEGLLLGVEALLGEGRDLHDEVAAPGVEDRLALGAAVGVGQEGLEVRRQQALRAGLQRLRQLLLQRLEHPVVGAALGVARRVLLRVHRGQEDLFVVVGQARGDVREPEEHRVPYQVEQRRGHEARPLPGHLAVAAAAAVAPVLQGVVVVLADADLLEAVPLDPPSLVRPPELRANLRAEPVEEVEDGRGVAAEEGPGQAEGLAAGVGEDSRGDALGRASGLELVHLVAYEQVEEARHVVLHVVTERVAGRARSVRLPEGRPADLQAVRPGVHDQGRTGALASVQVGVGEGHPVLVRYLRRAAGAAWDPEGFPRFLHPYEPAIGRRRPVDDGGLPAVGQLGPLPAHHREQRAGADREPEPLQVGDGGDDDGADAGNRLLHLPLPLPHQVRRADDEHPSEARHVRGGGPDEGLARPHLPNDGGAPVGLEREGRAPDGVGLRSQWLPQQPGEHPAVLRGAVERRVGLHHPPGDGLLERVDESSEVHCCRPPVPEMAGGRRREPGTLPPTRAGGRGLGQRNVRRPTWGRVGSGNAPRRLLGCARPHPADLLMRLAWEPCRGRWCSPGSHRRSRRPVG